MQPDLWQLPTPVDGLAVAVWWLLAGPCWWLVATPVRNLLELGVWWLIVWAWAVLKLLALGAWGAAQGDVLFKGGEDVAAFSGGRASWLGFGAKIIRVRKRASAMVSGAAVTVGWGGAALLYVVALVWWLCVPIVLGWAWWRWWSLQPRPWEG